MTKYQNLTEEQIAALESTGCKCEDWSQVRVAEGFIPKYVRNVIFSGNVSLGVFDKKLTLTGGLSRHSGIYNAILHNVVVGDNCLVENVQGYIANYVIGAGVLIRNVTDITVEGDTSFGNGTLCNVLDETGSTAVRIHDRLSSHEAYIVSSYLDRHRLLGAIDAMVDKYVSEVTSSFGIIGENSVIMDVKYIQNVKFGPYAKIIGATRLRNGSVNSNASAPVHIGQNVIMDDFIVCSGSSVTDGVMLSRCFVGQACILGHSYSASDSLFFSNCLGENGEACSLFAGPYTVTHHKSTLLIAGRFSFMNAGSGSNQSNHMYKLGPIHYGELQRGAKTTSDSYILWPAKVGAFSLVMGRHVNNIDSTDLPFSYLIEQQGVSYIVPGVNLKSVGTIRDVKKWPKRDGRKDPDRLDKINFNLLSPVTIRKMFNGLGILRNLKEASGSRADNYSFNKATIRNSALFKGIHYYESAILKFLGNSLISRIEAQDISTDEKLRAVLIPDSSTGRGEWADISGLIAPQSEIDALCRDIEDGRIKNISELDGRFEEMLANYYSYEWTWAHDAIEEFFGTSLQTITREQAAEIVRKWKNAVIGLDKQIYEDARKECSRYPAMMENFEKDSTVQAVSEHIARKSALGDSIIAKLLS